MTHLLAHVRDLHQRLTQSQFRYKQIVINGMQNIYVYYPHSHKRTLSCVRTCMACTSTSHNLSVDTDKSVINDK